jgi:hypothetical protein
MALHDGTVVQQVQQHCKKSLAIFTFPAGMSLTKLSLAGNNLIILGQEYFIILFPCPGTI